MAKGSTHAGQNFDDTQWLSGAVFDTADAFGDSDFGGTDPKVNGSSVLLTNCLAVQDPDERTFGPDLELNEIEDSIVRIAERKIKGRRGSAAAQKSQRAYITHEDFDEGPERDAFLLIFGYAEILFEADSISHPSSKSLEKLTAERRNKAVEFFFCDRLHALNFEEAARCISTEIRADVLRMRFMYEFWLRKWQIGPMPSDAVGVPTRVELMAARFGGVLAMQMVTEAWFHPGIEAIKLLDLMSDKDNLPLREEAVKTMSQLVDAYVLSVADEGIYCTGVNPILELEDRQNDPTLQQRSRLANIYWSRRW